MRALPVVLMSLALLSGLPRRAAGQQGPQANLLLSVFGGAVSGHELWSVARQPVQSLGPPVYDTMALSRATTSGIMAGLSATYFGSGLLGFHGELTYAEHPFDDGCNMLSPAPAPDNDELCQSIRAGTHGGGVVSLMAGVTVRAATRGWIVPYLRGSVGVAAYSSSTAEVAGFFTDSIGNVGERVIILDNDASRASPSAIVAAGLTAAIGTAYQLRLEVRDLIAGETVLTGSADGLGRAPTETRVSHHVALVIGFDIVLERKRGRRY